MILQQHSWRSDTVTEDKFRVDDVGEGSLVQFQLQTGPDLKLQLTEILLKVFTFPIIARSSCLNFILLTISKCF